MNDYTVRAVAAAGIAALLALTSTACEPNSSVKKGTAEAKKRYAAGDTGPDPGPAEPSCDKAHRRPGIHVATYTAGQTITAAAVTLTLGYRLPARAWLAGAAINGATHYVIDRREPLKRFLRHPLIGKGGYLTHATVQRREGVIDEGGPGTALMECDQAAHRLIGVAAAAVATCLAIRSNR